MKLTALVAVMTKEGLKWKKPDHKKIVENNKDAKKMVEAMTVEQELWQYGSGKPLSGPIGYAVVKIVKKIIDKVIIGTSIK